MKSRLYLFVLILLCFNSVSVLAEKTAVSVKFFNNTDSALHIQLKQAPANTPDDIDRLPVKRSAELIAGGKKQVFITGNHRWLFWQAYNASSELVKQGSIYIRPGKTHIQVKID